MEVLLQTLKHFLLRFHSEYLLGLFTIVASTIVGWSTPSIIGWTKFKKQARVVFQYHQRINKLGTIDQDDVGSVDELNFDIGNAYSKRMISDKQNENIKEEIGNLYEEAYRKKIFSLTIFDDDKELRDVRDEVSSAYRNGKISNEQYQNTKNEISLRYREIFEKKIESLKQTIKMDQPGILNKLITEIDDAYGKGMLNELHYNLVNGKHCRIQE